MRISNPQYYFIWIRILLFISLIVMCGRLCSKVSSIQTANTHTHTRRLLLAVTCFLDVLPLVFFFCSLRTKFLCHCLDEGKNGCLLRALYGFRRSRNVKIKSFFLAHPATFRHYFSSISGQYSLDIVRFKRVWLLNDDETRPTLMTTMTTTQRRYGILFMELIS